MILEEQIHGWKDSEGRESVTARAPDSFGCWIGRRCAYFCSHERDSLAHDRSSYFTAIATNSREYWSGRKIRNATASFPRYSPGNGSPRYPQARARAAGR
ncbi:hypothetical protein, partial [Arthrobacter sp. H14]|uniref:hypothetical protein n=1 Tax=Arthrobacter sp. H14 TaxID=1312959 RepID=UPI001C1E1D6E